MSALAYSYSEPYKLPAGALALVVHGAFFALLYFGVNWHNEQPQGMVVDIWNALPAPQAEPVKVVLQPVPQVEQPRPVTPPKADIALPAKKKPKAPEPKQAVEVKKPPVQLKQTVPKISEAELAQQAAQAEQGRAREAQVAATGKVVDEYVARIRAKIKPNIVMPPDAQDNMQAEFDVILIPDGSVLSVKLTKPSGSIAYDEVVERAIMKAQRLPLPPDPSLFNRFRELHLTFTPKEKE
jgi:colicin import membrane protein